jgi:hypothetical protein
MLSHENCGLEVEMRFYWLLLGVLSVWRISHLLVFEDGPFQLLEKTRRRVEGGFLHGLLDCFYCLSLWVAIPLAASLGQSLTERLMLWPALSAGAILLHRISRFQPQLRTALYCEDQAEDPENVLRQI